MIGKFCRFSLIVLLFSVIVTFEMCSKDNPPPSSIMQLAITGFTPQTGYAGNLVEIDGTNFSPVKEQNTVAFNGAVAVVNSATTTKLLVIVPDSITTGKITVTVNGKIAASPTDFLRPSLPTPTIVHIQWLYGRAGDKVVIFGTNFTESSNVVRFNGLKADIITSSPSQIAVIVPQGVTTGKISINVMGEVITTVDNFTVLPDVNSVVSTFAGNGIQGHVDGEASVAQFDTPGAISMDDMNNLFIQDGQDNKSIRKITPLGVVSTIATLPIFNAISGIAVTTTGIIYASDASNHIIRKITPSGEVSIFAGSYGRAGNVNGFRTSASFNVPTSLILDRIGNLLVADYYNGSIRKITPDGIVTTFAGDNALSKVTAPHALTLDSNGNLFVANDLTILKISSLGEETFIAGGGSGAFQEGFGSQATFYSAAGITVDKSGNVYVAEGNYNRIRKVTPEGLVYTIAGTGENGYIDGKGLEAMFFQPLGVVADAKGNLFVTDGNSRIRKVTF